MTGRLTRVTAPEQEPFNLPDLTEWLNVVRDDQATLLEQAAIAAREHVELITARRLITQTWDLYLPAFADVITLPYPPLQEVVSVQYLDLAGILQTLTTSPPAYETWVPTGETADPGEIRSTYLTLWPDTRATWNAVQIRFTCGYGDSFEEVPAGLRKAIDRLTEEQYRIRGVTVSGSRDRLQQSGFSLTTALTPYRVLDAWWREA